MVARVVTVAFEGVEARRVDVEAQIISGAVVFAVVGLGDKAVAESTERVRAAFAGLASPCRPAASSSTCRPRICPRRAATTTCRSPWR